MERITVNHKSVVKLKKLISSVMRNQSSKYNAKNKTVSLNGVMIVFDVKGKIASVYTNNGLCKVYQTYVVLLHHKFVEHFDLIRKRTQEEALKSLSPALLKRKVKAFSIKWFAAKCPEVTSTEDRILLQIYMEN